MKRRTALFFLLALTWCTSVEAVTVGPYVLTNLGALPNGNDQSCATGVNSFGQVVGRSTSSVVERSFLWQPNVANGTTGSLIDLGSLRVNGPSYATAINSMGQIVGWTSTDGFNATYIWTPTSPNGTVGSMTVVGGSPFSDGFNVPYGVNSYGQVIGRGQTESKERPFLWTPDTPNGTNGSMLNLNSFGFDQNVASAINSNGQVVVDDRYTAIVWTPNTPHGMIGTLKDLPRVGSGAAINARGQVVGTAIVSGPRDAVLWNPTVPNGAVYSIIDLAGISNDSNSAGNAINSNGQVVGSWNGHAFVWTPRIPNGSSGNMIDLNLLLNADTQAHWTLFNATGVNDLGQIVGNGMFDPDGPGGQPAVQRGYLLTLVPEPRAMVLIGLGLAIALLGPQFRGCLGQRPS